MKFGVREICDVVFRAKSARKIGTRQFYKNEPVLYFDSLKTSTLEGAVTTVYAQGGRGNARLVAWDGERTLTFTMEDALISDLGIAILASAELIGATEEKPIQVHATSTFELAGVVKGADDKVTSGNYELTKDKKGIKIYMNDESGNPIKDIYSDGNSIYVMFMENGEVVTEPYIATIATVEEEGETKGQRIEGQIVIQGGTNYTPVDLWNDMGKYTQVIVDYYVSKKSGVTQVDITPETFGGNFYIEASTLFRDQVSGVDMPAEFVIPNGKVQSNFTFTMASSGDPSTFTFTVDALPDYTRFDKTKKVLAAIQVITEDVDSQTALRKQTDADTVVVAE